MALPEQSRAAAYTSHVAIACDVDFSAGSAPLALPVTVFASRGSAPPKANVRQLASPQQLSASVEADITAIHLGDHLPLRLRVEHPPGWTVTWPDSVVSEPFEVISYAPLDPTASADLGFSAADLVITAFTLGEHEIAAIPIVVTAPDGTTHTVTTDPFIIGVESVGLDESGNLRDIKGPLWLERDWLALWPWFLGTLLAVGAFVYVRRRWAHRRSSPQAPLVPSTPARPFHIVALEELAALEQSELLARGRVKEFHIQVSEIVRRYIEGQLQVPALEMTTDEVADGLRSAAVGPKITNSFTAFLAHADLVKFAKLRPDREASHTMIARARALVKSTSGSAMMESAPPVASQPGTDTQLPSAVAP